MSEFSLHSIETIVISLPARRPHLWAGMTAPAGRGYVVVKLRLMGGAIGWGEAQTIATWGGDDGCRYGETAETACSVIEKYLAPALAEIDLRRIEAVHQAMDRVLRGHPYAKAAVEIAALDAVTRQLEMPVYQMLGGKFRDRIPVAHSIGLMEISSAVEEVQQVAAEGVGTIKLKIGIDVERDVELVREVRRALGDDIAIRVDANQGYATVHEALRAVEEMYQYRLLYMEQPVEGLERMAQFAARCRLPVMADESCWSERDVVRIGQTAAAQYLSVYYTKPGGLWNARRLLTIAGAHGLISDINGSGEMGIGNAANLQLAAAAPGIQLAGTIPITSTAEIERTKTAGRKYLDDIIVEPFAYVDGYLVVPESPGLGIEVDEKKIAKYRVN